MKAEWFKGVHWMTDDKRGYGKESLVHAVLKWNPLRTLCGRAIGNNKSEALLVDVDCVPCARLMALLSECLPESDDA